MNKTGYEPYAPFVGIAPDATLGACKSSLFSLLWFIVVYQIEYSGALEIVHQVRTSDTFLLRFSWLALYFVNPCVDAITQAIYRAYEDNSDISECVRLMVLMSKMFEKVSLRRSHQFLQQWTCSSSFVETE